jgi:hypothetical protein
MDSLTRSLDKSALGTWLVVALGLVAVLAIVAIVLGFQLRQVKNKWGRLLESAGREGLDSLLDRSILEQEALREGLTDSQERIRTLEAKMRSAKRYLGLVRYDAFDDVGGSQSFSLAVYDEEGNGAVLTSQVGREGCRVYGKALSNGRSERHLTTEEETAIEEAVAARPRPRITP